MGPEFGGRKMSWARSAIPALNHGDSHLQSVPEAQALVSAQTPPARGSGNQARTGRERERSVCMYVCVSIPEGTKTPTIS